MINRLISHTPFLLSSLIIAFILAPIQEVRADSFRPTAEPLAGLTGICDFLLTRGPIQSVMQAPFVTVTEAKNDNVRSGLGQCIAEMVAARMVNEQSGIEGAVHGIATTGTTWLFSRLDGSVLTLDTREYTLAEIKTIMGILKVILKQ